VRALAAIALLASTAASAQSATYAYLPFKMQSSAAQPFGWYLDSRIANPAGLSLSAVQASAQAAWTTWNNVSCALPKTQFLGLSGSVPIPNPTDAYDVYSTIAVWATSTGDSHYQRYLYGIPDIMAMGIPISYAGVLETCDVYLNAVNFQWSTTLPTATDFMDLQSVLLHEFGHCLGLDHHSFHPDDVMQPSIPKGTSRRTLTVADTGSLCDRNPVAGAVGAPCFADGGCGADGGTCVTQNVNSVPKTFCSIGCNTGTGFVCELPLSCKAANFFAPTYTGACLMNDGSETDVGKACTADNQCGSSAGLCKQPFQGISGTTFWQSGYCTQNCLPGRPPCPGGAACTTIAVGDDICLAQCRVGYADCRPGYACAQTTNGGVCVPECLNDLDCGDTSVWQCRTCDGLCIEKQNPSGQVGDVCTADSQCGPGQICGRFSASNNLRICTIGCARGCGVCPTGSACHPVGLKQELYCLRSCSQGTCAAGEQCAQLPTGRGCFPGCTFDGDCAVGMVCNPYGECVEFGNGDGGCPFCPGNDDAGNAPRKDAGTGNGNNGNCGCSTLSGAQTFLALSLVLSFSARRRSWRKTKKASPSDGQAA
jgi:hypothetical protein